MEGHVDDREVDALGVKAFTDIATALGERMREAGAPGDDASISALMALLERFAYFLVLAAPRIDDDRRSTPSPRWCTAASSAPPVPLVG